MEAQLRDFSRPGCRYVTDHCNGLPQEGACDLMVLIRWLDKSELKLYELSAKGMVKGGWGLSRKKYHFLSVLVSKTTNN